MRQHFLRIKPKHLQPVEGSRTGEGDVGLTCGGWTAGVGGEGRGGEVKGEGRKRELGMGRGREGKGRERLFEEVRKGRGGRGFSRRRSGGREAREEREGQEEDEQGRTLLEDLPEVNLDTSDGLTLRLVNAAR